jgi:hypothetical protein
LDEDLVLGFISFVKELTFLFLERVSLTYKALQFVNELEHMLLEPDVL